MISWPHRKPNKLQPQSVNPRRGAISPRHGQSQTSRIWLWWLIGLTMLMIALAILAYYLYSQVFIVKSIRIDQPVEAYPAGIINQSEVEQYVQAAHHQSLVTYPLDRLEQDLLTHFPAIAEVHIDKRWPDSLSITYLPRVAAVQVQTDNQSYLLDRQGYVYAQTSWSAIPQVQAANSTINLGTTVEAQNLQLALKLSDGLRNGQYNLKHIILQPQYVEVELQDQPTILVASDKSADKALVIINDLLSYINQNHRSVKTIDLRYDRPILQQ